MSRLAHALIPCLAISTLASAQSSKTLPAGFDSKAGNSSFWAGFDIKDSTRTHNPSRSIFLYDSRAFPWGQAPRIVRELRVRRHSSIPSATTTAHSKQVRMWMSTNGSAAQRPNTVRFAANHGTNRTPVIGSASNTKRITFPAVAVPSAGPASFNVSYALDRPFVVASGTKTLAIEIRSYSASVSSGRWRVDSSRYGNADGGKGSIIEPVTCETPKIDVIQPGIWRGNDLGTRYDTQRPNTAVLAMLGLRLGQGIALPGTGTPACKLWVQPLIFVAGVSGPTSDGTFMAKYGPIPDEASFVGVKVAQQLLVPHSNSLGFVLSRAIESQIGAGFASNVLATTLYSHGFRTGKFDGKLVDPDTEDDPRHFSGRAPIFEVR